MSVAKEIIAVCEEIRLEKRKTAAEVLTEIVNAYPGCFYRIVQVNKNGHWNTLEDNFGGILLGWEKELGSINCYVDGDYRGISIEVLDAEGFVKARCADFYLNKN